MPKLLYYDCLYYLYFASYVKKTCISLQITSVIADLTIKCAREVRCIDISSSGDMHIQKSLLADKPDMVVATPSRALAHLKAGNMKLKDDLAVMVVDEADLVFSFGYEDEIKELLG